MEPQPPHDPLNDLDRSVWEASGGSDPVPPVDVERALARLQAQTRGEPGSRRVGAHVRGAAALDVRRSRWTPAMFALGGLLTAAIVWFAFFRAAPRLSQVRDYATQAGQRLTVTLPDGTRMTLAPSSRVRIPATYARSRAVALEGEAYFAVVHDPAHPFSVASGNVRITDVGTEFDVRAYTGDGDVCVAVARGSVAVQRSNGAADSRQAATVLAAGDLATIVEDRVTVAHRADIAAATGWFNGHLIFRRTRFADAARELGRFYDIDIHIADSALSNEEVTDDFSSASKETMLAILAATLDAHVVEQGRTVVFTRAEGHQK